jgi:hypothetical protein
VTTRCVAAAATESDERGARNSGLAGGGDFERSSSFLEEKSVDIGFRKKRKKLNRAFSHWSVAGLICRITS